MRASTATKGSGRKDADDREGPVQPEAFAAFWKAYPKKDSKPAAIKKWNVALRRGTDPEVIIAGARAYRDSPRRNVGYTKNPVTWLNNDCWENEDEAVPSIPRQGHGAYVESDDRTYGPLSSAFDTPGA